MKMIKKFYITNLKRNYEIPIAARYLKHRLEKWFEIEKDKKGNFFCAEETKVFEIMGLIKKDIEFSKISNPVEKFKMLVDTIPELEKKKYEFTIKTYSEFAIKYLTKSHAIRIMTIVNTLINTLQFIIDNICKDICNVNDEEIYGLLVEETKVGNQIFISKYLKYLNNNYDEEIQFCLNNKVILKHNQKNVDDFYSFDEWSLFVKYLCDLDTHIVKAFKNKAYAKYWLFFILHLSLTWRKNDITSFPALDFLELDGYDLNWFYENEFTMEDAMYIIFNTKLFVEQYYTHKTNTKLHFNIGLSMIIPTAIALLIMELWRRRENSEYLLIKKSIKEETIHKLFDGRMDNFASRKANRTLLSFVNEKADELDMTKSVSIASYMRSHKMDYYNTSDSTKVYLKSTYSDKELHFVSKTLFDKGPFGWLFDYVVSSINDNKNMQFKSYDIDSLENISEFLLSEQCNKQTVINELMQCSKEELEDILKGKVISKQEYVYCTKQICNRVTDSKCIECKYSIPTIYAMYAVTDEIHLLMKKITKLEQQHIKDKERYLYRLIKLLGVAKSFGNVYGENNLQLFLNFNDIMQQTKLLLEGSI